MSVIAEIQLAGDFALSELLRELPDVRLQLERVVPAGNRTIPLIWIPAADPEPAEQQLRDHRLIKSITRLDTFEDRALYRIDWAEEPDSVFTEIRTQRAVLLDAVGVGESWEFELRFPTHNALSEFYANCKETGISLTIDRIYRPSDTESSTRYGLTDIQYDTLFQALKQGYFNIPREIETAELASQYSISDQAVTEQLRRGMTNVFTQIFVLSDDAVGNAP
jgi:predicted DNA binding protein